MLPPPGLGTAHALELARLRDELITRRLLLTSLVIPLSTCRQCVGQIREHCAAVRAQCVELREHCAVLKARLAAQQDRLRQRLESD